MLGRQDAEAGSDLRPNPKARQLLPFVLWPSGRSMLYQEEEPLEAASIDPQDEGKGP